MYRKLGFILPIVLLLVSVGASMCTVPRPSSTPRFAEFMKMGDSIDAVAVAPNGEVWVSTFEYGEENFVTPVSRGTGVAHFDGQTWTTYTTDDGLAGNRVGAIAVTPDGVVWFGTEGGATRLDGETLRAEPLRQHPEQSGGQDEAWTTYTAEDGLAEGDNVSIAVAPDGAVWFGTWGGVSRFYGETWITYTTEDGLPGDFEGIVMVEDIAVAPDGVVWVATRDDGVSRLTDPADTSAPHPRSGAGGMGDGETLRAEPLRQHPEQSGGQDEAWITYTTVDGLADDSVRGIAVAPDGTIWIGTHYGVSRFDPTGTTGDGGTWTTYTEEHGLADNSIRSIVVAPNGTVWVSYYDWTVGVSRFNGETWTTFNTDDGLPSNSVASITVAPDSALWVSTEAGTVSRFDGETWITFTIKDIAGR